jgi:hypothetical protein
MRARRRVAGGISEGGERKGSVSLLNLKYDFPVLFCQLYS